MARCPREWPWASAAENSLAYRYPQTDSTSRSQVQSQWLLAATGLQGLQWLLGTGQLAAVALTAEEVAGW